MRSVLALAKRNCLCFFRDRQSVFFSMMAALIVLLLYLLFLRDNLISSYPGIPGMDNFVDVWVVSGLVSVVSVTSCAGALQTMVEDRIEGRDMDVLVTPMNPYKVAFGHIISTFVCGFMMSIIVLAVGLVYLFATGCPLTAQGIMLTILLTVPAALSGCTIMYAITSLIKSVGAFSGTFTTVSVLIGLATAERPARPHPDRKRLRTRNTDGIRSARGTCWRGTRRIGNDRSRTCRIPLRPWFRPWYRRIPVHSCY